MYRPPPNTFAVFPANVQFSTEICKCSIVPSAAPIPPPRPEYLLSAVFCVVVRLTAVCRAELLVNTQSVTRSEAITDGGLWLLKAIPPALILNGKSARAPDAVLLRNLEPTTSTVSQLYALTAVSSKCLKDRSRDSRPRNAVSITDKGKL